MYILYPAVGSIFQWLCFPGLGQIFTLETEGKILETEGKFLETEQVTNQPAVQHEQFATPY